MSSTSSSQHHAPVSPNPKYPMPRRNPSATPARRNNHTSSSSPSNQSVSSSTTTPPRPSNYTTTSSCIPTPRRNLNYPLPSSTSSPAHSSNHQQQQYHRTKTPVKTPRRSAHQQQQLACNTPSRAISTSALRAPRRAGESTPTFKISFQPRSRATAEHVVDPDVDSDGDNSKYVPFHEDLIAATPKKEDNDKWLENFGIDVSLLKMVGKQHESELKLQNESDLANITGVPSLPPTPSVINKHKTTTLYHSSSPSGSVSPLPMMHMDSNDTSNIEDDNDYFASSYISSYNMYEQDDQENSKQDLNMKQEEQYDINEDRLRMIQTNLKTMDQIEHHKIHSPTQQVLFHDIPPPSRIPRPRYRSSTDSTLRSPNPNLNVNNTNNKSHKDNDMSEATEALNKIRISSPRPQNSLGIALEKIPAPSRIPRPRQRCTSELTGDNMNVNANATQPNRPGTIDQNSNSNTNNNNRMSGTTVPDTSNETSSPKEAMMSMSARRKRRVSRRELKGLELPEGSNSMGSNMKNENVLFNNTSANSATGSSVFLKPVRASRKQKEILGTSTVVTPVRRSMRLSRKLVPNSVTNEDRPSITIDLEETVPIAPAPHAEERSQLLSKSDYAFAPNHHLSSN